MGGGLTFDSLVLLMVEAAVSKFSLITLAFILISGSRAASFLLALRYLLSGMVAGSNCPSSTWKGDSSCV